MRYLFDYGEFLLCVAPIFLGVAAIGARLLWNSLPDRTVKRKPKNE